MKKFFKFEKIQTHINIDKTNLQNKKIKLDKYFLSDD